MDGIDYIVSYIDFSQKEIKDLYREVAGEEYASNVNSDYLDFTLTLKLILKNMPFINKLYITCKDVQKLPEGTDRLIKESNGRIVRVNESEFMPTGFITFASNCIEMFLWQIPSLGEKFIYGNDDMIPLQKMEAYEFFNDGKPIGHANWYEPQFTSMYNMHELNATNLIYDRHKNNDNYQEVCCPEHSLRALTKSICRECYERYEPFITASLYPIRYFNGFNADMFMMYGLRHKLIEDRELPYKYAYYSATEENAKALLDKAMNGEEIEDVVCMNDECWITDDEAAKVKQILNELMTKLYEE